METDKEIDIKEGILTDDKVNNEARKKILINLNRSHQFKPSYQKRRQLNKERKLNYFKTLVDVVRKKTSSGLPNKNLDELMAA